jgi:hypothetical protein
MPLLSSVWSTFRFEFFTTRVDSKPSYGDFQQVSMNPASGGNKKAAKRSTANFSRWEMGSVPHPFALFLAKGWDTVNLKQPCSLREKMRAWLFFASRYSTIALNPVASFPWVVVQLIQLRQ